MKIHIPVSRISSLEYSFLTDQFCH